MIRSTGQRALYPCKLRLEDGVLEQAGLFPLFDTMGQTRALMLVTASSPQIRLIDYEPGQFSRQALWRKRLALRRADLRDSTGEDAERLADLWHFDPWWALGAERYAGHAAVPPLKSTNIPGYDKSLTRLWFASDLSRVTWAGTGRDEGFKAMKFRPHLLDRAAHQRGLNRSAPNGERPETGWVLRPWW